MICKTKKKNVLKNKKKCRKNLILSGNPFRKTKKGSKLQDFDRIKVKDK